MAGIPGNAIDISATGVVYFNASQFQSIAPGASGTVLTSTGATAPTWQTLPGNLTMGPFGTTPNANGGTITGTTLTLQPAGTGFPGGLSVGTQSISGVKTFNSIPIILTLTGVVTSGGASGLTGSVIGQFGTLVAGPINSLVSIAPGTTGQVLTSNGPGVNPSYQTNSAVAGIVTLAGNTGTATGSSVQISGSNSGSSVTFSASGAAVNLNVSDSNSNTIIGNNAGNNTISGGTNTSVGKFSLNSLTNGQGNSSLGSTSLGSITSGSFNVGVGYQAGGNYRSSESNNILLNNSGVLGESNTLRIGTDTSSGSQGLTKAFISGINGNTSANPMMVTINSATDQLGVAAIPGSADFSSVVIRTFIVPGSHTNGYIPTSGMLYCIVECVGGGGSGGGGVSADAGGGGGGGGGYCRGFFSAATIGSSQNIVVAGSTPGTTGAGSNGAPTVFGNSTLLQANGGHGGIQSSTAFNSGGSGGSSSGGSIQITGGAGGYGFITNGPGSISGMGGSSYFGTGGLSTNNQSAGNAGNNYGAGGSGGTSSTSSTAGGNGAQGIIVVTEFIS